MSVKKAGGRGKQDSKNVCKSLVENNGHAQLNQMQTQVGLADGYQQSIVQRRRESMMPNDVAPGGVIASNIPGEALVLLSYDTQLPASVGKRTRMSALWHALHSMCKNNKHTRAHSRCVLCAMCAMCAHVFVCTQVSLAWQQGWKERAV